MNLLETIKVGRKFLLFRSGLMTCDSCGKKIIRDTHGRVRPKSFFVTCLWCGTSNFVPFYLGRFWLYEPAGGGGVSSVYRAFEKNRFRLCAVKVLRRDKLDDSEGIEAYKREVSALASIGRHRHIVRLLAHGNTDNEYYCAMKFVEGQRLDEKIAQKGRIPELEAVRILSDLITAELHIYSKGFLYRDIKPENIMIQENGRPVLVDFGLCQPRGKVSVHVEADFVDGSAHYMPPERLQCDSEGPWSEIYSLGMLMYEMLTGDKFIKSSVSEEAITEKHVHGLRMSVPSGLKNLHRPELVKIVEKMIRREAKERYQSFENLQRALYRIVPRSFWSGWLNQAFVKLGIKKK